MTAVRAENPMVLWLSGNIHVEEKKVAAVPSTTDVRYLSDLKPK